MKTHLTRWTGLLLAAYGLHLAQASQAAAPADLGFIDARDYGTAGDGVTDDTAALQAAINAGLAQDKPVFVPAGTYLVSDTLWGKVQGANDCGGTAAKPLQLVGSTAGTRPLIKLAANAHAGFDIANPSDAQLKPVLHVWLDDTVGIDNPLYNPADDRESCLFRAGIRGIDFDISGGHPSAVAIKFPAAQKCFLQDVRIIADGAFAGIAGLPGRNASNGNIEVVGGRHGIYCKGDSLGATLVGVRLVNQTDAALVSSIYRGVALTGLEVVSSTNVAPLRLLNAGSTYSGNLTITDARFELGANTPAVADNSTGRYFSLRNAYIKGGQTLVSGIPAADQLALNPAGWMRVIDYAYTPATINGVVATNVTDGLRNNTTSKLTEAADSAPSDMVARHIWSNTPSFEDADAYVITGPSGGDDSPVLQAAIDSHAKVYLGLGTYYLNSTITLRANTVLMGTPGYRSELKPTTGFMNSYPTPARGWIVDTDDDADATTTIMDVYISGVDSKTSGLGDLRWRAGRGMVRSIRVFYGNSYYESHRNNLVVTGQGGGRFYSYTEAYATRLYNNGASPHNPLFRKVVISGTRNPLTFYGLNLERGGNPETGQEQAPFCEINDARNVRVFGTKSESIGVVYNITDSDNIALHSIHTNPNSSSYSWLMELIHVSNSTNVDFRNLYWPGNTERLLVGADSGEPVYRSDFIGTYRAGTFDPAPWGVDEAPVAATAANLAVSEIHYNPAAPTALEQLAGYADSRRFEFVEFRNTGAEPVSLVGVTLQLGVSVESFPGCALQLKPGAAAVYAADPDAFACRYGGGFAIAGRFAAGSDLADTGERLQLLAADASVIADFTYATAAPWPAAAAGQGPSIVLIQPGWRDPADGWNWRASFAAGGNPCASDAVTFGAWVDANFALPDPDYPSISQPDADPDADGLTNLEEYFLGTDPLSSTPGSALPEVGLQSIDTGSGPSTYAVFSFRYAIAHESVRFEAVSSPDLSSWTTAGLVLLEPPFAHGDSTETRGYRSDSPVGADFRRYFSLNLLLDH